MNGYGEHGSVIGLKRFGLAVAVAVVAVGQPAQAIVIPVVRIGHAGNQADRRYIDSYHPNGVGSVAQAFNIGKTEVTNAQYLAFLNAVAAADPYGLYDANMSSLVWGGIVRFGQPGGYFYRLKTPALGGTYKYDDKPVVYVNSGDAMRFANWLYHNQPNGAQDAGTTEDGAYTLNGAVTDAAIAAVTRNSGASWWIPSESEWYKAAYYDPSLGIYYDYPTGTNSIPNNNPPSSDTGNSANFYGSGYTTGDGSYSLTDVGAYQNSESPYGTFDQGGSVWEWTETMFATAGGLRGSSWNYYANRLHASVLHRLSPTSHSYDVGFRIANMAVPGDYNGNGAADAADYVMWRRNPGGMYVPSDYGNWRANFGQTAAAAALARVAAVPEPVGHLPAVFVVGWWIDCRRRRTNGRRPRRGI